MPLDDYMLQLEFESGEKGLFDVKPYIHGEWFGALMDEAVFQTVHIAGLSIEWADGQDIAPDCLYLNAIRTA